MHPMCSHVTIFCCFSADVHAEMGAPVEERNAYAKCEADLQAKLSKLGGSGLVTSPQLSGRIFYDRDDEN